MKFSNLLFALLSLPLLSCAGFGSKRSEAPSSNANGILGTVRTIQTGGTRSGEGYFSADGRFMTFQSEQAGNPFYQIYLMEYPAGTPKRISTGKGKTTCSWIDPKDQTVIFSSTHLDPKSAEKERQELEERKNPAQRRYAWDYDENFDIFRFSRDGRLVKRLTNEMGYDAEASISPDGQWIVFSSNRHAYTAKLAPEDQHKLTQDPSYFLDLYIMRRDGSGVRRLTTSPGYDGGPFFSPDGSRVIWRRFSADGRTAEVFTMKTDGTDEKQLTRLNAMSWAPFYHPSGDYVVFTSSVYGHHNFELFIVDAEGTKTPVRITEFPGFDGLPVFHPNGNELTWNRKMQDGTSQIVAASWDDKAARAKLGLPPRAPTVRNMSAEVTVDDAKTIVEFLASRELAGRGTGSTGERKAIEAYEKFFGDLKLSPPFAGNYRDSFSFVKEARLGHRNELTLMGDSQRTLQLGTDWQPMALSKTGEVAAGEIVFAGYGIRTPHGHAVAYDSLEGIDVKDKWAVIFRYWPEDLGKDKTVELQRYARLEHKMALLKNAGARGAIVISGPNANAKNPLIPFQKNTASDSGLPVITVTDAIAEEWVRSVTGQTLKALQTQYDKGEKIAGFNIPKFRLSAAVSVIYERGLSQNVSGLLKVPGATRTLIIGAHGDHLGDDPQEDTLRKSDDKETIHFGADDNASGVAAVLELAHRLTNEHRAGRLKLKQNILFTVWSGEERGNLGSHHFVTKQMRRVRPSAYINMDMIGRWERAESARKPLSVQGVGSSDAWADIFKTIDFKMPLQFHQDPYLPTDAISFYTAGVPVISLFSGAHTDYHTPRDTADKISYWGIVDTATLVEKLAFEIAGNDRVLKHKPYTAPKAEQRRGFRIYLGTIPDYTGQSVRGVKLSGVVSGGPAEKAGLKTGDVIVELDHKKIENINDYVFTLEGVKPNAETVVVVMRDGEKKSLTIVPTARE